MTKKLDDGGPPAKRLETLALSAIEVAKKAKKHSQGLSGSGFYANKLSELRIAATNAFSELRSGNAGDTSALAELIGAVFAPPTTQKLRLSAQRELVFSLRTTWRDGTPVNTAASGDPLFPLTLLEQTKRGYLIIVGRQLNGCFTNGYYDACAVMIRRLFEISIIESFEAKGVSHKIKNAAGDYMQLSDLVSCALSEPSLNLSRNAKKALPRLRDAGHLSAHGRSYFAYKTDIERIQPDLRIAVEELIRVAGLL